MGINQLYNVLISGKDTAYWPKNSVVCELSMTLFFSPGYELLSEHQNKRDFKAQKKANRTRDNPCIYSRNNHSLQDRG